MTRRHYLAVLPLALLLVAPPVSAQTAAGDWPTHGRDAGGARFSPLDQITPDNVAELSEAWTYHMKGPAGGAAEDPDAASNAQRQAEGAGPFRTGGRFSASETTPLMVGGILYLSTPYHAIVALRAETGEEIWKFEVPGSGQPSLRGVEYWPGTLQSPAEILFGTRDGRLFALDAATGQPIAGFGNQGVVDMKTPEVMGDTPTTGRIPPLGMTSPPFVWKNLVVTGSAVQEFPAIGAYGDIRAWDVRTGALVWTFHTVPRPGEAGHDSWAGESWKQRSGVNNWGFMTADERRGILYVSLGAPSWDRYGGDRVGDNLYSTAVVALDAKTGRRLWHFQVVHHDIWDFDAEAPPTLFDVRKNGAVIPAVGVVSKSAFMFILDRRSGKPIYPVTETKVPASNVPGEHASPTQPMPVAPPPLARVTASRDQLSTVTPEQAEFCRKLVEDNNINLGGPFLPTGSDRVTVNFPGTLGGINYGGGAFDERHRTFIVNSMDLAQTQMLVPAANSPLPYKQGPLFGRFWQAGTRMPCQAPPWGSLIAVEVDTGKIAWKSTLGVTDSLPADKAKTGRPSLGGPIVTAGGLVFIAATDDARFRAFASATGEEKWVFKLPASAHATPITFLGRDGRQYVVIVATGGSFLNTPIDSDAVMAFALKK
jgi:quinoprotein glucose dehydrogenase